MGRRGRDVKTSPQHLPTCGSAVNQEENLGKEATGGDTHTGEPVDARMKTPVLRAEQSQDRRG